MKSLIQIFSKRGFKLSSFIYFLACMWRVESYNVRARTARDRLDGVIWLSDSEISTCRRQVLSKFGLMALTLTPLPVTGLSPEEAATAYNSYASTYDDLDGGKASSALGIDEARTSLFGKARGSVLEIGAGTGLNLNKYNLSQISSLTLLDISEGEQIKRIFLCCC